MEISRTAFGWFGRGLFAAVVFGQMLFAQTPAVTKTKLEQIIPPLMKEADIPGLALALVRDGKLAACVSTRR